MKLLWTGTDSLMLVDLSRRKWTKRPYWWLFRIGVRLIEPFIQEHYAKSNLIVLNLKKFGMRKPIKLWNEEIDRFKLSKLERIKKKEHEGFNVLYYYPKSVMENKFVRWLYGIDLIEKLRDSLPIEVQVNVNFICVDGRLDMAEIYPIVDMYLRPKRHDGYSRMIKECQVLDIPYYWSRFGMPHEFVMKLIFNKHYYEQIQSNTV